MTAKEYLGQAYLIDQRINSKLEQVMSLRTLATKATSTMTDMPRSASPNIRSMEDIIGKMVDLESEINADIDALVDLKREIVSLIALIPTREQRTILELRYLCSKTWEEIACETFYSVRNVHILHSAALREMGKLLDKTKPE